MSFGNDEILEFALGIQKDPSVDKLLATMPKEMKKKLGGGMESATKGMERSWMTSIKRMGAFAVGALGIGGFAALTQRAMKVADIEQATSQLGRAADLTRFQEDALGRSIESNAMSTGRTREEQLAAMKLLQDRYAVVNKLANEGTLGDQLELGAKMANAFDMELTDVMNLMGSLNQLMDITGPEMIETMAFLEEASKRGSLGMRELGQVFPDLLGEAKAFGEEGQASVRTIGAMVETVTAFYKDQERARTYTRQALMRLSNTDVQKRLQSELGVTVDETKSLRDVVQETLNSLEGMGSRQEAMGKLFDIFGSEEAVNAWKALLTERGTFENIITIEAGTKDFTTYLEDQNNMAATEMGKFKEKMKGVLDQTIFTEEGLDALTLAVETTAEAFVDFTWIFGSFMGKLKEWAVKLGMIKKFEEFEVEEPEAFGVTKGEGGAMDVISRAIEYEPGMEMTPADQQFMQWYAKHGGDRASLIDTPYYETEEEKRTAMSEQLAGRYKDLPKLASEYSSEWETQNAKDTVQQSLEALQALINEYAASVKEGSKEKIVKVDFKINGEQAPPAEFTYP